MIHFLNSFVQLKVCKYKEIVDSEEEVKACQCGQFSMPSLVQQDEFCGYCVPILPSHEDCQSKCEAVEDSEQETVIYFYFQISKHLMSNAPAYLGLSLLRKHHCINQIQEMLLSKS